MTHGEFSQFTSRQIAKARAGQLANLADDYHLHNLSVIEWNWFDKGLPSISITMLAKALFLYMVYRVSYF